MVVKHRGCKPRFLDLICTRVFTHLGIYFNADLWLLVLVHLSKAQDFSAEMVTCFALRSFKSRVQFGVTSLVQCENP